MSDETVPDERGSTVGQSDGGGLQRRSARPLLGYLSFSKVSGVYVGAALILAYSLWLPETFLTRATWINVGTSQAVTALVTIGLLFPLAAGAFDLSFSWTLCLSAVVAAKMLSSGYGTGSVVLTALAMGIAIGLVNGLLVVVFDISSFIATLGVSSVLTAIVIGVTQQNVVVGVPTDYQEFALRTVGGVPITVLYVIVIGIIAWWVLEHTAFGRQLFAVGAAPEAARLAGVRTGWALALAFVISGCMAAIAGLLATSYLSVGDPNLGTVYLLPAFAAAFLGATQFKPGRFNVAGTLLAVYVLAIGVQGLTLAGASVWVPPLFNGVVLIVAVGLAQFRSRPRVWRLPRKRLPSAT